MEDKWGRLTPMSSAAGPASALMPVTARSHKALLPLNDPPDSCNAPLAGPLEDGDFLLEPVSESIPFYIQIVTSL
jgi:hypothetical protein